MKFSDIRDLKNNELEETLQTLRKNLFTIRLKSKIIEKKELYNLRPMKRDVARILTLINSRKKDNIRVENNRDNRNKSDNENIENISNSGE